MGCAGGGSHRVEFTCGATWDVWEHQELSMERGRKKGEAERQSTGEGAQFNIFASIAMVWCAAGR